MEAAFVPGLRFLAGQVPRRCPIPLQPSLSRTHMRSQPRFQRETLATFKLNGKSDSLLNVRFPYNQCLSPSLLKPTTLYMLRPQLWQASHSKWRPPGYLSLFSSCAPFPPRFLPSLLLPFYFASPLSSVLEALPSTHPLLCRVGCFCWYRCFHLGWFFFFFYRASSQFRKFTDLVTRIPLTCFTHVILFQSYISILSLISLYMHARRDIDTTCTHWPFDANTWMYRTRVCILVCTQTYIQFHLLLIIFLFRFPFLILFTTLLSSSS